MKGGVCPGCVSWPAKRARRGGGQLWWRHAAKIACLAMRTKRCRKTVAISRARMKKSNVKEACSPWVIAPPALNRPEQRWTCTFACPC